MILAIHLRLESPAMRDVADAAAALEALAKRLRSLQDDERLPLVIQDRTGLPVGSCSFLPTANRCPACRGIKKWDGHGTCGVCGDSW